MSKSKCCEANLELYKLLEENDCYEDTRFYGMFISNSASKRKIKIDIKRYHKMIGLSEDQLLIMKKRKSHYYIPSKKSWRNYYCNLFISLIEKILNEWEKDYKPLIQKEIEAIQAKKYSPGDDHLFMCGIIDSGEASISALINSARAEAQAKRKRENLYLSLNAQFFHQMVSKIEAQTIKVLWKNGFSGHRFSRNDLYQFKGMTFEKIKELNGFKDYDKMYLIWHFIKHNSMSTYNAVKENYPEVLAKLKDGAKYEAGDMAYEYIEFNSELITNILKGVIEFFKNYCELVYDENYDRAQWDYEEYFVNRVNDEIDRIVNPLGLPDFL